METSWSDSICAKSGYLHLIVTADRVKIVSQGKETPTCTESRDLCWQQNRRGHFLFTAK